MGDVPPAKGQHSADSPAPEAHGQMVAATPAILGLSRSSDPSNPTFASSSQGHAPSGFSSPHAPRLGTHRHPVAQSHEQEPSAFNMGMLTATLPDYSNDPTLRHHPNQLQQRNAPGPLAAGGVVFQGQENLQFRGPSSTGMAQNLPYNAGYMPAHYQQYLPAGMSTLQQPYQNFQQHPPYGMYYSPYGPQMAFPQTYPTHVAQTQPIAARKPSVPPNQMPMLGQNPEPHPDASYSAGSAYLGGSPPGAGVNMGVSGTQSVSQGMSTLPPNIGLGSIPRGPPRKPKQSGHALWVGNLPPGTTVLDLKDHFSRDATKDIESLFLISKSNCAFVNYRTEAACTAAMHRFHDSRFQGVRLVCRLRRSTAPSSGIPTGPSAMVKQNAFSASPPQSPTGLDADGAPPEPQYTGAESSAEQSKRKSDAAVKYFIIKSLTLQDLESSVRTGIWATQSHNEEVLNRAFQTAEKVFLIFSANKSGEYFGYARMASPMMENQSELLESTFSRVPLEVDDGPKSIPTPATEFAPRGRIIDDSARGTIFWEADLSDTEGEDEEHDKEGSTTPDGAYSPTKAPDWGKPFKIEWISTNRLPFYRTRGLRNPWNANREVKIARDGTELETGVGERLVQMFHRLGPSSASGPALHPQQMGGPPMPPY